MESSSEARRILAIECAVANGSVAVLEGSTVIASNDGLVSGPSRAELILSVVTEVLKDADSSLRELNLIAVSLGPGSYSGIRIGLATALGLKNSLGIECTGVSVLGAIAMSASHPNILCAIPVGKKDVAWQAYDIDDQDFRAVGTPELTSQSDFLSKLSFHRDRVIYAHPELLARLESNDLRELEVVDAGLCLASLIGRAAVLGGGDRDLRAIYLRNQTHAASSAGF